MECGNEAIDHAQVRFAGADRLAHCCRRLPALRPTAVCAHSSTFVRLRSDADSNVIAAWGRNPGSGGILTSARRPAGGNWGDATVIESLTTVPSIFLWSSLAVSPDGSAAADWIEGYNETSTPWVNVYR